jgi:predicted acyl esterase
VVWRCARPVGARHRDIPEWKIAVIQDAPSEFAHQFMYPGGGFALGNALGWVQIVDRMFRASGGTARQFLGVFTGPSPMRRAVATLPVADADIALTGRRVPWFQEWIRHGPDDPYWQATDHRDNVARMPPVVYLQGGWYDFFLRGMLADYAALQAADRTVRLLIGRWGHGRGLYTRVGLRDAVAALDAALADGTLGGAGVCYRFPPLDRPVRLAPACPRHRMVSASGRPARHPPSRRRTPELVSL